MVSFDFVFKILILKKFKIMLLSPKRKGKVSLDLFDKVIHGFMQFTAFSAESREAFEIVIKRHQEACFSN